MPNAPRDLAGRMAGRRVRQRLDDGFVREQFTAARNRTADGAFLDRFPAGLYECSRTLARAARRLIEFTMRRRGGGLIRAALAEQPMFKGLRFVTLFQTGDEFGFNSPRSFQARI